jgi:hypothetical protein
LAGFELNASISVSRDMKIEDGGQWGRFEIKKIKIITKIRIINW